MIPVKLNSLHHGQFFRLYDDLHEEPSSPDPESKLSRIRGAVVDVREWTVSVKLQGAVKTETWDGSCLVVKLDALPEYQKSSPENLETVEVSEETKALAERIFAALPEDGSTIGNVTIREMIKFDKDEDYDPAKEYLVASGRAIAGRGRGGSLRRTQ